MKKTYFGYPLLFAIFSLAMIGCTKTSLTETSQDHPGDLAQAQVVNDAARAKLISSNYIVVLKNDVADVDSEVDQLSRNLNIKAKFRYRHAIIGFAAELPPAAIEALRNNPKVAYIEQDQAVNLVNTVTPLSWGLDRVDQQSLPLSNTYTYNTDAAGVDAYIIDCGILLGHTDFEGRAVTGYDAITSGGTATDGNGHGTHVAGTVGGKAYGVAKAVKLIAVRVLDNNGSGTMSGVIAGVDWVTGDHTNRPAVANMSLGGGASTALDDAVRRSINDGITYVVAAGNSSVDASTTSPARVIAAITVGATDVYDRFASFSNYGSVVDISAPGVNIKSAWHTSTTAINTISGTSMAAPHVAGAAALYLAGNPTASPDAVQSAIKANGTTGKITNLPTGTVNLLLYTLTGTTTPPPVSTGPATPTLISPANGSGNVSRTPTLDWNASSGALTYTVQVATDQGFTSIVYNNTGLTTTSIILPLLSSRANYYWRVSASNATGTSSWSAIWKFRTRK